MPRLSRAKLFAALVVAVASLLLAPAGAYAIEAEADRILRAMGEYLKSANEFSFHAEISYDEVLSTGEKVQYGGSSDLSVRRPNRLLVDFEGDEHRRQVFYDGSTITLFDMLKNLYAVTEVPSELDNAMDLVFEKFGLTVPLADFVYADPHAVLTEAAEYGSVIGVHGCGEKRCHHLLFTQEAIDWQIWIETGPRPVPRQLVITYKEEPGSPQYAARLSRWDFQPRLSEHAFTFRPPDGASEIEFLPRSAQQEVEQ
jgi:hypothetical protein